MTNKTTVAASAVVGMLWLTSDLAQAWQAIVADPARYAMAGGGRRWYSWFEANQHIESLTLPLILVVAAIGFHVRVPGGGT